MCPLGKHLIDTQVRWDACDAKGGSDQHKVVEPVRVRD
jgi:hypothetical protein